MNNFQSRLTSKFATQAVARTRKPYLETYLEVTQAANFDSVLVRVSFFSREFYLVHSVLAKVRLIFYQQKMNLNELTKAS